MEGRRSSSKYEEEESIRKGPWKAEEDDVLIKHVHKYGPRDWSSIRSKGLLQRTGKSCRLRWVNKLRPNLKNGCKFTAEEERVVIELQAEFGNKWAKIATYLPGRTDNDVKNFWSSRQKRLARILHTSTTSTTPPNCSSSSSNSKPQRNTSKKESQVPLAFHQLPSLELPTLSSSTEEELSTKPQCCSSSYVEGVEPIRMALPEPNMVKIELPSCNDNLNLNPLQYDSSQLLIPFTHIPQPQPELTFSIDSHDLLEARLEEDPYLYGMFGPVAPELGEASQLALPPPLLGPSTARDAKSSASATPDTFFDDFPEDMFDPIEPLPSPSEW